MAVKTELQTRRDLIDSALKKASWDAQDRTRVVSQVDTETVERLRGDCEEGMGASEEKQKMIVGRCGLYDKLILNRTRNYIISSAIETCGEIRCVL